jgi:hypothetical protein
MSSPERKSLRTLVLEAMDGASGLPMEFMREMERLAASAVQVFATKDSVPPDRVSSIDKCLSVASSRTRPSSPASQANPTSPRATALRRTLSGIWRAAAFMILLARAGPSKSFPQADEEGAQK